MSLTQVSTGGIKDGQVHTADLADAQITAGKLHADALDRTYTLGADGSNHYTFTGEGLTGAVNDPALHLTRGKTYRFVNGNSSGAHPFRIQTTVNGSAGTEYNTGVTNNGGAGGTTIVFEVPHAAPDRLYYQCTSHGSMGGILYITGGIADGSITNPMIADDAINSEHYADLSINNAHLNNSSVTTNKIENNAVILAKLEQGTSSNDGKFLRANNGADPTFETVNTDLVSDTTPQLGGHLDTNSKDIEFSDNASAKFGASTDLEIYHDPTSNDSFIKESGSGALKVCSNLFRANNAANTEAMIKAEENDSVDLYYDNSKKFQTTSTGIQTVETIKMTHGGNGVNLRQVFEQGVGNTASCTAQVPDCVGGGTVTVTCMHNGNTSISATRMYPIMIRGSGASRLGSEMFTINSLTTPNFSVNTADRGITVTNNAGAHAKIRITFDITANFAVDT